MELTKEEIQILFQIIDNTSLPVKQTREIVNPIITKLEQQLEALNKPENKE